MTRRAVALIGAVGLVPLTLATSPAALADQGERTYRVTIVNLTAGQAVTPVVAATHSRHTEVFEVGEPASVGVQQIAENGNLTPLVDALSSNTDVSDLVRGQTPPVPEARVGPTGFPNATTFTITASARADRMSYVAMLICTNDGWLPACSPQSRTAEPSKPACRPTPAGSARHSRADPRRCRRHPQ